MSVGKYCDLRKVLAVTGLWSTQQKFVWSSFSAQQSVSATEETEQVCYIEKGSSYIINVHDCITIIVAYCLMRCCSRLYYDCG
jgi:hypothetical protein